MAHPQLNIAIRAARAAGNVINRYVDRVYTLHVTSKERNDFVTEVDRHAERVIIDTIRAAYPEHGILAEESGRYEGEATHRWLIDPLDGTTNFLHGFPPFAVSIALEAHGQLEQAVVYDPVRDELFTASRGSGAYLNNRRIRVSGARRLYGALLGTGFPFKQPEHLDDYLQTFKAFCQDTAGIRRAGSAAIDLAYVAVGRLDGFWELGLKPWDMAAGVLLIKEAGGLVSDFGGGTDYLQSGHVLAGTPDVFDGMAGVLRTHLPAELQR